MLKVRKIIPSKVLRGCLLLFIISVSFASSPAVPGSCDTDREVNPRLLTQVNPRFTPQWSPDGKSIAFTFGYWAKGSTYLANADGSSVRLISGPMSLRMVPVSFTQRQGIDGKNHLRGPSVATSKLKHPASTDLIDAGLRTMDCGTFHQLGPRMVHLLLSRGLECVTLLTVLVEITESFLPLLMAPKRK